MMYLLVTKLLILVMLNIHMGNNGGIIIIDNYPYRLL